MIIVFFVVVVENFEEFVGAAKQNVRTKLKFGFVVYVYVVIVAVNFCKKIIVKEKIFHQKKFTKGTYCDNHTHATNCCFLAWEQG